MSDPLVSVLVRSMDRPSLDRALASAAAQDWPAVEVVVAAACGHRHRTLPERAGPHALRLVQAPDDRVLPRAEAANLALAAARGDWLVFLDDDDEFEPGHVRELASASRPPGTRVTHGATRVVDAAGREIGVMGAAGGHVQFLRGNRMQLGCVLFARSLVEEGAAFDPAFEVYEDYDFLVNLATRSPFAYVAAATSRWRAEDGDSGCGLGRNFRGDLNAVHGARVRAKWSGEMRAWREAFVSMLQRGQDALRRADPAALGLTERALREDPEDVNALNLAAMANHRAGRRERAAQLIARACEIAPGVPALEENRRLIAAA